MFNIHDPHQFFENYDDNEMLTSRWTMDLINRQDGKVWVMNHFFVNPKANLQKELGEEMKTAKFIAQKSHHPIWPLDPVVINYFENHPDFYSFWYNRPYSK